MILEPFQPSWMGYTADFCRSFQAACQLLQGKNLISKRRLDLLKWLRRRVNTQQYNVMVLSFISSRSSNRWMSNLILPILLSWVEAHQLVKWSWWWWQTSMGSWSIQEHHASISPFLPPNLNDEQYLDINILFFVIFIFKSKFLSLLHRLGHQVGVSKHTQPQHHLDRPPACVAPTNYFKTEVIYSKPQTPYQNHIHVQTFRSHCYSKQNWRNPNPRKVEKGTRKNK